MMSNWINTKSVFEWDKESQKYIEVYNEGYEYEGELALAQDIAPDREARYPKTAFGGAQIPLDTRPDVGDVMTVPSAHLPMQTPSLTSIVIP